MWKEFVLRRYRRTYLSVIWIPLRPGIDILSRTLLFGGFLQVGSGDRPYFIYIAFASAGWQIFNSSLHWGARSMRQGKAITSGLYFPSVGLIGGSIGPVMIDFLLYSAVAIIGTFYYLVVQGRDYLAGPSSMLVGVLGLFLLLVFGLSLSLIIAPLGMITKEIRYLISYLLQFWYLITPVVYDLNHIPAKYRLYAEVNPITAPIEMVKSGFVSTGGPTTLSLISCFIGLGVALFGGLAFFSRFERAAVERL
jgi:ABC-type polysaccharide/polyol phosphate export permease